MKLTLTFRALARSILAVFGALTLPLSAFAAAITGEPTAAMSASFDGSTTSTGWFTSWGGGTGSISYIDSTYGQAFTVVTNAHPYYNYTSKTQSDFSIALYANGDNIVTESGGTTQAFGESDTATTPCVLWGMGTRSSGIILAKTSATTYALIRRTADTETGYTTLDSVEVTAGEGYHLFVATWDYDTGTGRLYVDGTAGTSQTAGTASASIESGFQIGAVYNGLGSYYRRAYGLIVDEIRGYDTVLTTEDVARLNGLFSGTLTATGSTTYTHPTFGQSFTNVFRATDTTSPTDYATLANWYTPRVLQDSAGTTTTYWDSYTGSLAPGLESSSEWAATLVDGSLFPSTLEKDSTTNRYEVSLSSARMEGWALKLGVANNVHLTINDLRKLQSDAGNNNNSWVYVDETSKLTITTLGSQGSNLLGGKFYIMSEEGMTVTNAVTADPASVTFNYYLYDKGSVLYAGGLSTKARTHTVAEVTLALGDNTKKGREIVTRKLIGFSSTASQTYNYTNTGVTTVDNASSTTVSATEKTSEVELFDAVGTYYFYEGSDGYYVQYVAYGDNITYTRTVTGTTAEDWSTTENSWGIYRGEAEVTAPDANGKALVTTTDSVASTLTMNAAQTLETFAVEGSGSLTLVAGTYTTTTESTDESGTTTETTADGSLTVTETTLYAPLTVESGASLGTVNVSDGGSLAVTSLDQFTTLNGDELTTVGAITLSSASDATKIPSTLNIKASTVTLGYSGFAASKTINVGGGTTAAALNLGIVDATGYTTAGTGIYLLTNGTLEVAHRDTFITPLTMQGGTLKLLSGAADSGRAFDFFASGGNTVNVRAAEGATGTTVSNWTAVDASGTSSYIAIRQGALNIDVAANAELDVDATLATSSSWTGTAGALNKTGEGKLVFKRANSYTTATNLSAGTIQLVDAGTLGESVVTIDAGATVDFASTAATTHTNAMANSGTISFTGSGTTTLSGAIANAGGTIAQSGTGTTTLSGEVEEGTITVSAGTLNVPTLTYANATVSGGTLNGIIMGTVTVTGEVTLAGTMPTVVNNGTIMVADGQTLTMTAGDEGNITVAEGGTLKLVLSAYDYIYGYTPKGTITNNGTVELYIPGTTEFTTADLFKTYEKTAVSYTSEMKVWTAAEVTEGNASGSWTDAERWNSGTLPADTDATAIYITRDTTITVSENDTVASVAVYSTNGANLTFVNESSAQLTVKGAFSVGSSMTITDAPPVLLCDSLNVDRDVNLIFTPGELNIPEGETITAMECPTTQFTGLGTLRLQGLPHGTAKALTIAPTLTFYLVDTKLGLTESGTDGVIGIDGDSILYETVPGAFTNVDFEGVTTTTVDAETGETVETTTYGTVEIALTTAGDEATTTTLPVAHFDDFAGTLLISGGRYNAGSEPINADTKITITDGGQLYLTGGTWANTITASGSGWTPSTENPDSASGAPLRIDSTTLTGSVTLGDATTSTSIYVYQELTGTISSTLTAASGFTKLGDGTLTLTGQTYADVAGTVTVSAGTLDWDAATKVSAGTTVALGDTIAVNEGATLNLHVSTATVSSDTPSELVTIASAITLNGATLTTEDGSYDYSKAFTVTGSSTYSMVYRKTAIFENLIGDTDATLTASVTSKTDSSTPARFTVLGGDFNGTLTWGGDTTSGSLVDSWLGVGDADVFADATISFTGVQSFLRLLSDATVGSLTITTASTTGGVFTDGTGAKTLTLKGGTINYALKDVSSGANSSSPLNLIVAGNVTLNGANTLSGTVAVNSGTLTVDPVTADSTATATAVFTNKTVTLASGATLDLLSGSGTTINLTNNGGTVNYQAGKVTIPATRTKTSDPTMITDAGTYTVGAGQTLEVDMDLGASMGEGYTFSNITFESDSDGTNTGTVKFLDLFGNTFPDATITSNTTAKTYVFTLGSATWTASDEGTGSWSKTPQTSTLTTTSGDTTTTETYTNTKLVVDFGSTTGKEFTFGSSTTTGSLNISRSVYLEVKGSGTVNINTGSTTLPLRVGRVAYDESSSATVVMKNSSPVMFTGAVYGNASLVYEGSANVTVTNRALANSTYQGVLTLNGTGEFHLGNVTDDGQAAYTLTNGSVTGVGSHVIINEGNTLYIHVWEDNQDSTTGGYTHSQTATDLVSFITPVTLNGGTLYSQDGAYYFTKAVTVNNGTATDGSAVTSTIRQNWGKTLAFEKITGAGDLIWDSTNGDPTDDTKYNAWSVVKSTDITGTVTFSRSGKGRRLVIPSTGCFENTSVAFSDDGDLTKLVLEGDRTIGMISGSGVTVVSGTTGTDGAVTEVDGHVLTVAGISSTTSSETTEEATVASTEATVSGDFAGVIDNTVPLTLGANSPDLTISGTLGDNTYTQAVTLNSGTLTLAPSAATTLSGAITNNASLVLGGTTETTISGSISGTGSVSCTGSATLTGGNSYKGGTTVDGTLTINGNSATTMVLPESGSTSGPTTVTVNSGATLKLVQGLSYTTIAGDGTTQVTDNGTYTFGASGAYSNALGTASVVIDEGATLQYRGWQTHAFTPTSLTVNGTLKNDGYSGATASTLTIPSGGTLSGLGTISMATTLADGSTLHVDEPTATGGSLSVSSLAYGTDGDVTLVFDSTLPEQELYTHVLRMETESDVAPIPSSPTFVEANSTVYNIKLTSSAPNLSAYKCVIPNMSDYSNESVRKITNVGYGMELSSVTGQTLTGRETPTTLGTEDLNNAFALFDNVVQIESGTDASSGATTHKAVISYDFGISGVTVVTENDTSYAILTVKVSGGTESAPAAFSSGTSVAVYNGDTQITDVTEVADATGATGTSSTTGVKYLKVPLSATTGTTALTVKATDSTTASN